MLALRGTEAVVVAPLLQLSFLITAAASFLLFGEPVGARKLVGIALGALAMWVFGTSAG